MNSIIYDTHSEYKGFIEAGFNQRQAEQITQALKHSFEKNLANKEDIARLELKIIETNKEITLIKQDIETIKKDTESIRKEFDFKIADVKKEIEQLRADTKKEFAQTNERIEQLRMDTKKDIEQLRADTKKDIEQLRTDTKKEFAQTNERIEQLRADTALKIESEGRKNSNKLLIVFIPSLLALTAITIGAMFAIMNAFNGL